MVDRDVKCPDDHEPLVNMTVFGTSDLYPCFRCFTLYRKLDDSLRFMFMLQRCEDGSWRFGTNRQTAINSLWSDDVEQLYNSWIAKEIVT